MPDEHRAADEHAIAQDLTAPRDALVRPGLRDRRSGVPDRPPRLRKAAVDAYVERSTRSSASSPRSARRARRSARRSSASARRPPTSCAAPTRRPTRSPSARARRPRTALQCRARDEAAALLAGGQGQDRPPGQRRRPRAGRSAPASSPTCAALVRGAATASPARPTSASPPEPPTTGDVHGRRSPSTTGVVGGRGPEDEADDATEPAAGRPGRRGAAAGRVRRGGGRDRSGPPRRGGPGRHPGDVVGRARLRARRRRRAGRRLRPGRDRPASASTCATSAAAGHRLLGGRRRARRPRPVLVPRHAARGARRRGPARSCSDPHPPRPRRRAPASLVERFPDLQVYVHERGYPHLAGPAQARGERLAALRRRHGAPVGRDRSPCPRRTSTPVRRRDARGRLGGRVHPGPRLPPRRLLPRGRGLLRRRRRRAHPAGRTSRSRPRRRRTSTSRPGTRRSTSSPSGRPSCSPDPLRRSTGRREPPGQDSPGASTPGSRSCATRGRGRFIGRLSERGRGGVGGRPRDRRPRTSRPPRPSSCTPAWPATRERGAGTGRERDRRAAAHVGGPDSGLGGDWRVIVLNDRPQHLRARGATLARFIPGVTLDGGYAFADRSTTPARRSSGRAPRRSPSSTGSSSRTRG